MNPLTQFVQQSPIASGSVLTQFVAALRDGSSVWVHVVDDVSGAAIEQEITADLLASTHVRSLRPLPATSLGSSRKSTSRLSLAAVSKTPSLEDSRQAIVRDLRFPVQIEDPRMNPQIFLSFNLPTATHQDLFARILHPTPQVPHMETSEMKDVLEPIADYPLSQDQIDQYRRDGFIVLPDVVTGAALEALRSAVEAAVAAETGMMRAPGATLGTYEKIFNQKVNIWRRHAAVAEFTLSKALGTIAARLEGVPMRIWHDQALFKEPGLGDNKTPWHQDAVYWPHQDRWRQTTIWLALRDATARNGCMSFLPGTQALGPLEPINLADPSDLYKQAPQFASTKPTICPLKAGSATFHNGLNWHFAGPNKSDEVREAYAVIFMPDGTRYDGAPHVVTDEMNLSVGEVLAGEAFPLVS